MKRLSEQQGLNFKYENLSRDNIKEMCKFKSDNPIQEILFGHSEFINFYSYQQFKNRKINKQISKLLSLGDVVDNDMHYMG